MSLVSASEMAALRGIAESGMESTCTIYARTTTQTDNGRVSGYATTGTESICWLTEFTPTGSALGVLDGAEAISETFKLRLPVGTTIHSGDKVVILTADYY